MKNTFFKKTLLCGLAVSLVLPSWAAIPVSQYGYDAAGRLASVETGVGATTTYSYNSLNELTTENWPGAVGAIQYGYNAQGRLGSVQDPRGLGTSYVRNGFGEVTQQTSPDAGTESFVYDEAGNVLSRTLATGATISYQYDVLNRVTSMSAADSLANFTYDAGQNGKGLLTLMQDDSGSTGFNYDVHGNVTSRTHNIVGGASLGVLSSYSAGRLTQRTYPSGQVVSYTYDAERVSSISVNGVAVLTNVEYAPFGGPSSWQMGAAGAYSRTFDTAGRMVSYTSENGQRTVSWDAANRITAIQNADASTWAYSSDALDRLSSSDEGSQGTRQYTLDAVGNRTAVSVNGNTFSYGLDSASNKLTSSAAPGATYRSYNYDASGRALSDGSRSYTWTNRGHLATATLGSTVANYTYNGFGQRVKKVFGTKTRYYVYADDGVSLLGEYWQAGAGTPVGSLNEIVYLEGIPVLALKGGAVFYIQPDHLNAPRVIRNAAGAVVWRWSSDAFGQGAADQTAGGTLFDFSPRFPGQLFDVETGLHYNNARYYDPEVGRYISSDPIGLAGGINTYGYVGQAPTGAVDPTGHLSIVLQGGAAFTAILGLEGNIGVFLSGYQGRGDFGFFVQGGVSTGLQAPGASAQVGLLGGDVDTIRGVTHNVSGAAMGGCVTAMLSPQGEFLGGTFGLSGEWGGALTYSKTSAWSAAEALGRMFDKYLGLPGVNK